MKRNRFFRFRVIAGCAALLLTVGVLLSLPFAELRALSAPTLFCNDVQWLRDGTYPVLRAAETAVDDFWIPLSFFELFDNVKIRRSYDTMKNLRLFIVSKEDTEQYLSFQIGNDLVQTERGSQFLLQTTMYRGECYLPMRTVCNYFGWSFEYTADKKTVRITDGRQTQTFAELLAPYTEPVTEPVTEPPTPVTDPPVPPPVTEPPTPVTDVPPTPGYRAETVVFTFEDIDGVYTEEILEILDEYGVNAVFFVTGEQLAAYPETAAEILCGGHTLGLHTMSGDETGLSDTETLLGQLGEENDLLCTLTKRKTRIARLPEGTHSGKLRLSDAARQAAADAGYILWDWNLAAYDDDPGYDADAVYAKVERGLRTIYTPVIRFHCTETAAAALPRILKLCTSVPQMRIVRVTEATEPVVFP